MEGCLALQRFRLVNACRSTSHTLIILAICYLLCFSIIIIFCCVIVFYRLCTAFLINDCVFFIVFLFFYLCLKHLTQGSFRNKLSISTK